MPSLRSMEWDEPVWKALCASVTLIPPFVRKRALGKIISACEKNAIERSSGKVETADVLKSVNENVPESVRKVCLETLAEHGMDISTAI
ncbi:MAG TPA: hypothetical protein VLX68_15660 [Chitinivibrionales bacterium]|nr:hypothetical protein [Chitinivibrionales bacterium]